MIRKLLPLVILGLAVSAAPAQAKPTICKKKAIVEILTANGESADAGIWQHQCGDVTHDGVKDVVFTVLSGGTAGTTHFGVIRGASDTAGKVELILFEQGYKVGIDRVSSKRFDIQQPYYDSDDANCCPSAFDVTPYRWNGSDFKVGKSSRHKKPQKRFQKRT